MPFRGGDRDKDKDLTENIFNQLPLREKTSG